MTNLLEMDYRQYFRNSQRIALLDAMERLLSVSSTTGFMDFMDQLKGLIPQHAFACGVFTLMNNGFRPTFLIKHNYSDDIFKKIARPDGVLSEPQIRGWIATREPQLFDPKRERNNRNAAWVEVFKTADLQNSIGHGVIESNSRVGTYFNFMRVDANIGEQHAFILKLLVPHMHLALQRVADQELKKNPAGINSSPLLTGRQMEALSLMYRGKTNWEISKILGISQSTVKFHVGEIIQRLNAANRTDAVSRARELRL